MMKDREKLIIKKLRKKLREAKIGTGILFSIIWNDAWDLFGEPEEVKDNMGFTDKEYNYLKERLDESYFKNDKR